MSVTLLVIKIFPHARCILFLCVTEISCMYRVVNTLKDYAIKALVNTVDHLGSVSYKVNDLLDEKVDEVSGTELRVSCIEQVSWVLIYCQHVRSTCIGLNWLFDFSRLNF